MSVIFKCKNCGYTSEEFLTRCPSCGALLSFEKIKTEKTSQKKFIKTNNKETISNNIEKLDIINLEDLLEKKVKALTPYEIEYISPLISKIYPSQTFLVGGQAGIGKTTFLIHLLLEILKKYSDKKAIYFFLEEIPYQISQRYKNKVKQLTQNNSVLKRFFISTNNELDQIIQSFEEYDFIVIDSVQMISYEEQTVYSSHQLSRDVLSYMISLIKASSRKPVLFLVSHISKEGDFFGSSFMEHIVDTSLFFSSFGLSDIRQVSVRKNRFGGTNEILFLKFNEEGILEKIENINSLFADFLSIQRKDTFETGFSLGVLPVGKSFILVPIESLVVQSKYAYPQRRAVNYDTRRLEQIIAVLKKHLNLEELNFFDVFVKVINGSLLPKKFLELLDVPVALSILSSFYNKPLKKYIYVGEIGLTGKIYIPSLISSFRQNFPYLLFNENNEVKVINQFSEFLNNS